MAKWHNNPYEDGIWNYNIDSFDTREEAIANGVEQYKGTVKGEFTDLFYDCYSYDSDDIPTVFYIGEEDKWNPRIDTDLILEQLVEDAYWVGGEADGDYINELSGDGYACRSLDKKLQDALNSWFDEQGVNEFYGITNVEEIDAKDYI